MPSGVPALTAARSISPVEICGIPNLSLMKFAWVPLPAPGAHARTSRSFVLWAALTGLAQCIALHVARYSATALQHARWTAQRADKRGDSLRTGEGSLTVRLCHGFLHGRPEKSLYARQIGGGIDTRQRGIGRDEHRNPLTMPHRPQLLERFGLLDRRNGEGRVRAQKFRTIRIQADMPVDRRRRR